MTVASRRFSVRRRHPGHLDQELTPADIAARAAHLEGAFAGPLRLGGPLLTVDTTRAVDVDALADRISTLLDLDTGQPEV